MAKKKLNPKEKRELEQKAKQEFFKANEEKRKQEQLEIEREIAAKEYERAIQNIENKDAETAVIKKSRAKAAGLKSTFVLEDGKLLMTSFGNGNTAVFDKYISEGDIQNAGLDAVLDVSQDRTDFQVSGRKIADAPVTNPAHRSEKKVAKGRAVKPGQDVIFCRENLEKMYFNNRTFDDNIHIQLIYNILDIDKVLAVQVNNVVFQLNNMFRRPMAEHDDLIGYIGSSNSYKDFSEKLNNNDKKKETYGLFSELIRKPQMGYFGSVFIPMDKNGNAIKEKDKTLDNPEWLEYEKKCYYLLAALGMLRQATAHGEEKNRASIYKLGPEYDTSSKKGCRLEIRKELDRLYSTRVHDLNTEFLNISSKDIHIIIKIFASEKESGKKESEKEQLIKDYYRFVVLKDYKNLGFSIKRLRETMIRQCADHITDEIYNTFRARINRLIDFTIWNHYKNENKENEDALVSDLRSCRKESEKEYIYRKEAKILWSNLKDKIDNKILREMNGESIRSIDDAFDAEVISDVVVSEHADPFCELIYLLTIFLDGKEINDLLTQLINRFDNISSFMDVMKQEGVYVKFSNQYKLFEKSADIVKELRVINSFARMSEIDDKLPKEVYKAMFLDAADILGYKESHASLEEYIESTFEKDEKADGSRDTRLRNFIKNNVIQSSRFKYLARYGNPKKVNKLAQNKIVLDFVLKDIPDEQIKFYYNSCNGCNKQYFPGMRDSLVEIIMSLNFENFRNVKQNVKDDTDDYSEAKDLKEKNMQRNIVRLYLTALYLVQKNLIYVNSRYFLAFHCAERDSMIYDPKTYTNEKYKNGLSRAAFAKEFIQEHKRKKRVQAYLVENFAHSDTWSLTAFRNCSEHLGAIRNMDEYIGDIRKVDSYFELYHYLVQRYLIDQFHFDCSLISTREATKGQPVMSVDRAEGKLLEYFKLVENYHCYCKDFVKALNVPFAYNLARYKNLSVDELFDRNNYRTNKKKEIETKEIWE